MLRKGLLSWTTAAVLLAGCGGGSAQVGASASVDGASASGAGKVGAGSPTQGASSASKSEKLEAEKTAPGAGHSPSSQAAREPLYDPKLVRQALDASATEPADGRARLGLRLAVVEQGPDRPWLVAVVNRGMQPVRVVFDLRTLSLEVTPKAPDPDPDTKKKRAQPKPPKPVTCALPKDVVPKSEQRDLEVELPPGEALVDSFDPRLYCLPKDGASPLAPGATVVARLGWPEKTKQVWRKGKREQKVLEQVPPFLARLRAEAPSMPQPDSEQPTVTPRKPELESEGAAPDSDRHALKQLAAPALSLGDEYAEEIPGRDRDGKEPLALLASGSDAATERDATVTISLVNRSEDAYEIHFRREFVSFELSGPAGFVSCEPGPDERAPDRSLLSRLRPGKRLAAKSRLIELCPAGALRAPGLYLVHARFDASPGGPEARAYRGRLVSRKPATIRVRKGWGELPAQRAPLRVSVGTVAPE